MKAVQISGYGGVGVLKINANATKPIPLKGQVIVEVYAASINPIDWKIRLGSLKDYIPLQFPVILGGDFSGIVAEVGEGVSEFKVGDEVFGQGGILNGGSGSFAEFVSANLKKVSKKPKSIDHIQAAALPLAGVSALQAIEDTIKITQGQKILIHGGAGGIGHIAIQLAKTLGAYVATTVGSNDKEFVKGLGADEVIDYKHEAFENKLKDFNAVFDTVGGQTSNKSFKVLKKGGILVSMLGQPDLRLAKQYGVSAIGQNTDSNTKKLQRLKELVDNGKIKAYVDRVFPQDRAKEAFVYQEQGHPRGKVVLKIRE